MIGHDVLSEGLKKFPIFDHSTNQTPFFFQSSTWYFDSTCISIYDQSSSMSFLRIIIFTYFFIKNRKYIRKIDTRLQYKIFNETSRHFSNPISIYSLMRRSGKIINSVFRYTFSYYEHNFIIKLKIIQLFRLSENFAFRSCHSHTRWSNYY